MSRAPKAPLIFPHYTSDYRAHLCIRTNILRVMAHGPAVIRSDDDDVSRSWLPAPFDHQEIASLDAGIEHRIAFCFKEVRRLTILDEIVIERQYICDPFFGTCSKSHTGSIGEPSFTEQSKSVDSKIRQ
jgi:hypothetical protein